MTNHHAAIAEDPKSTPFDVAIIGGGVVGCAVLRALTLAGLKCLLLERGAGSHSGALVKQIREDRIQATMHRQGAVKSGSCSQDANAISKFTKSRACPFSRLTPRSSLPGARNKQTSFPIRC